MPKIILQQLEAGRVSNMAKKMKLPRQSIQSAIERGEIPVIQTADGLDLVTARDLKDWSKNRPKRGRPTKEMEKHDGEQNTHSRHIQ